MSYAIKKIVIQLECKDCNTKYQVLLNLLGIKFVQRDKKKQNIMTTILEQLINQDKKISIKNSIPFAYQVTEITNKQT